MDKPNIGKSIGVIIKNEKGEYLTQYRLRQPIGLALPAGHVDPGESLEEALRRELFEETGLFVVSHELVFQGNIDCGEYPCAKGHTSHDWWVYKVVTKGEPELKEPEKHKFVKFLSLGEIQAFIKLKEYDPNWFDHIFPILGIPI